MFSTLRGSRLLKEMRGIEEKLDVVNQNAAKQDKCFNFKFEKASKRARSDYQSKHWVVIKYAKIMTEGKLMPRFAKWAANRLTMRGEEGEDFALIVHTCEGNAAVVNPAMSTPSCTLQWTYIKNDCATKRTNKMFHICTQQEFSQPSCQHVGWARGGAWARPKWNFHVMASTFIWCVCVCFSFGFGILIVNVHAEFKMQAPPRRVSPYACQVLHASMSPNTHLQTFSFV
jgi:hypothetical protein